MSVLAAALRWDVVVQARSGFYWATGFIVLVVSALLLALPEAARADAAAWVPALVGANLQITTLFFVTGLMLLEHEEGTLAALAVTPMAPATYLVSRIVSLTALAAVETLAIAWTAFAPPPHPALVLAATAALGATYTGIGVVIGVRYRSVNALLLPAVAVAVGLLLPLLAHLGLAPRWPFLVHPIEPALTLLRAGYGRGGAPEIAYGLIGSAAWAAGAFCWARARIERLMADTRATGGR